MIRYKVIHSKDRTSCFCYDKQMELTYPKGEKVKAKEGSVGVFVFKTRTDADAFCRKHYGSDRGWTIIRVEAHDKGKTLRWRPTKFDLTTFKEIPKLIKQFSTVVSRQAKFHATPYRKEFRGLLFYENDGTMVYQSVTPLE